MRCLRWPKGQTSRAGRRINRRMMGIPCGHFFDDKGVLTLVFEKQNGQLMMIKVDTALGWPPKAAKHCESAEVQVNLGVQLDFSRLDINEIEIAPKEGRLMKIEAKILNILQDDFVDEKRATSLRGDLNFLSTTSHDKVVRGAAGALSEVVREKTSGPPSV